MTEIWTLGRTLSWIESYLTEKQDEHPRQSAQYLMSEVLGLSRIELYTQLDRPLTEEERAPLRSAVTRRAQGEPLQYITGKAPFRFLELKVAPGVLIPRPETEVLVSEGLAVLKSMREEARAAYLQVHAQQEEMHEEPSLQASDAQELSTVGLNEVLSYEEPVTDLQESPDKAAAFEFKPRVLDICTGSGCIALSVAHEFPESLVYASDISAVALDLARSNAELLGLQENVSFYQGDLGRAFPSDLMGTIQLILSNPPYIPSSLVHDLGAEVKDFEPHLALNGGEDGLDLYRRLLPFCARALCSGGAFGIELHEECLDQAAELAKSHKFIDVRIVNDLTNRPRFIFARKA